MGADKNQFMKALKEAEELRWPVPHHRLCTVHQPRPQDRSGSEPARRKTCRRCRLLASLALQSGIEKQGKNPFILDSKPPKDNFREFLMGETRFSSLQRTFPEIAEALFEKTEEDAKDRYEGYVRLEKAYDK